LPSKTAFYLGKRGYQRLQSQTKSLIYECYEFNPVPSVRGSGPSVLKLRRISLRFDDSRCCSAHGFIRFRPAIIPARNQIEPTHLRRGF